MNDDLLSGLHENLTKLAVIVKKHIQQQDDMTIAMVKALDEMVELAKHVNDLDRRIGRIEQLMANRN